MCLFPGSFRASPQLVLNASIALEPPVLELYQSPITTYYNSNTEICLLLGLPQRPVRDHILNVRILGA